MIDYDSQSQFNANLIMVSLRAKKEGVKIVNLTSLKRENNERIKLVKLGSPPLRCMTSTPTALAVCEIALTYPVGYVCLTLFTNCSFKFCLYNLIIDGLLILSKMGRI